MHAASEQARHLLEARIERVLALGLRRRGHRQLELARESLPTRLRRLEGHVLIGSGKESRRHLGNILVEERVREGDKVGILAKELDDLSLIHI